MGDSVPLTLAGLPDYIRNFNKASAPSKLNIWVPTRAETGKLQDPVTVRLVLPDILVAYCVLSTPTSRKGLSVETVTVSGPREQVPSTPLERTVNADCLPLDQTPLPVRVRGVPKSVPTNRQDGPDISTGVVPTTDGKDHVGSHVPPTDFVVSMRRVSCCRTRTFLSRAVRSVRGSCRWRRTFRRLRGCGSRVRENGGGGTLDTLLASKRRIFWKKGQLLIVAEMRHRATCYVRFTFVVQRHDQVGHRTAYRPGSRRGARSPRSS